MTRFSVIVPAYQVQAYLTGCLESVLNQTFEDLELIAVDDGSPDACGALIDEFAARDRRITALRLPAHGGAGPARDAGLARATGDYAIFLDGGATLVPGALRAIADRLKETGDPDVLVPGHPEDDRGSFAPADRPDLLGYPAAASGNAYRREFLVREGFAFLTGDHADTAWICPVLIAAESVTTLDRVCVRDERRHRGRPGRGGEDGPAGFVNADEVFDAYDRVFAFLDERPDAAAAPGGAAEAPGSAAAPDGSAAAPDGSAAAPDADRWRPVLHRRMLDHLAALAATDGMLPRRARAEFFHRARAHHRRYRAPGTGRGGRPRHALLRLGAHRTHRALRAARHLRKRLGRVATALLRTVRAGALRLHYAVQRRLPLRAGRAVFMTYGHGGYRGDPAAIEEKARELAPHLRTFWVSEAAYQHTVPTGTRKVRPGTFAYWTALARCAYLVSDTVFDHRLVKRRGQILLQTHSGTPLKAMGLDLLDRPAAARAGDLTRQLADAGRWDYSLSANRHSTLVRERAFLPSGTTLEYGHPRTDVFRRATAADIGRLRASLGIPADATAVLYAPTYRDYRRGPCELLDLERVARSLGPRFVLLARAHPAYGAPLPYTPHPRILDVSGHPSVERLCLASDALLTDYSSLMFDYAPLDRPIVIHDADREAYEAARGTYFDLRGFPPGVVAGTEDELIDIFTTGHWRGSRSSQLRTAFRARFCPYDDGRAAERVVRHVFLGETADRETANREPADPPGRVPPAREADAGQPRWPSAATAEAARSSR
ncbi:bifunctional glycosyltransferase family 2 protein/CDP-glycerol:glycerophosphate glycerophosphotransferase [Streptomyces sp. 35G-GA-8]|uniref:bifunctional glycosyltransferase/CDP-glycerol:glycerophosphate glycerophosphotransferase n=1 Tax=Streptomyces sp. 35G-GA-8 TaxID=2939434 RepID=UPI00201EED49|nr:bifunctional glycosyltransferase family 2 protein/CDP-glycerol:glycerophosphate glycerophosphotransferase [Streptomyces sp. 35G-GA-8]MCL7381486.1 bifunctional glycosyltransferase family 2 protein/CDP-glycerol:glycerophosphate glycerophosphotransferase [Streptomyces sp. 35G-GA-8]